MAENENKSHQKRAVLNPMIVEKLVLQYRHRARSLRRNAVFTLFLMVILLVVGVSIFIFAPKFAIEQGTYLPNGSKSSSSFGRSDAYKGEAFEVKTDE